MKTNEMELKIKDKIISLASPVVMGIINCTPDSFYSSSTAQKKNNLLRAAEKHLSEGASIIDLGGFSTRPNADIIDESEELDRVLNSLIWIKQAFPHALISIDTFRSKIAEESLKNGADIINDISAGNFDENMFSVIKQYNCPYILMHLQGNINTMHDGYTYTDVTQDVFEYFERKITQCREQGIEQLIIDPGFGFSKSMEDNYRLLNQLSVLNKLDLPILVGVSRKRMIWQLLKTTPELALNGTSVLNTVALLNGASILRVHDVKEAFESIQLIKRLK